MAKNVIVFLAAGFEEIEALTTVDLLRRAGMEVKMASVMDSRGVIGSHNIFVRADIMAADADFAATDLVVLPGGTVGTQNLGKSDIVKEQAKAFAAGKHVAAICAAPTVLAELGLLDGKKAVCYPGLDNKMGGALMQDAPAVVDGNIITGRSAGGAIPFALEIIRQMLGEDAMNKIKDEIVFR